MEVKYDIQLMVNVAQMYYIDGLKQEDIAKKLHISRSLISMILTEAKEVGIIDIKVRNPQLNNGELADELKSLFGLKYCVIVPTTVQDPNTLRKLVAQRAVEIFNQKVADRDNVGVAWGRTCYDFISYYKPDKAHKDVNIIPLTGGSNQTAPYYQLNEMVRLFAEKINGTPYFIHAPALTVSNQEQEMFMNSSSMQLIQEKWNNMDVIISSVGTLPTMNIDREPYTGEYEINEKLRDNEAVGDLCARYFNINGKYIKEGYYNRIIGIPILALKKAKIKITIASGKEKAIPILGCLRTGIVDVFISDEQTVKTVLKLDKEFKK